MTNHGMQTMSLKETAKLIKETRLLVDEENKNSTMEAQLDCCEFFTSGVMPRGYKDGSQ
jgi:hypothetical protein